MTATQSSKIYQIPFVHFKNDAVAKIVVEEIESIVDRNFEKEEMKFVPTTEFEKVDFKLELIRQEIKTVSFEIQFKNAKRINSLIIWIVLSGFATIGIIIAFIRIKS